MSLIVKPIVTEKLTALAERGKRKQYGFEVSLNAGKIAVKSAIEKMYGVQIDSLRSMIDPARSRTRNTKSGFISGKTGRTKKVYVTLKEGQEIDLYKNI